MDEPTSALDPIATNRIEELLVELKRSYYRDCNTQYVSSCPNFRLFDVYVFGRFSGIRQDRKMFTTPEDKRTEEYLTGRFG